MFRFIKTYKMTDKNNLQVPILIRNWGKNTIVRQYSELRLPPASKGRRPVATPYATHGLVVVRHQ